jgi:hypothetical protein
MPALEDYYCLQRAANRTCGTRSYPGSYPSVRLSNSLRSAFDRAISASRCLTRVGRTRPFFNGDLPQRRRWSRTPGHRGLYRVLVTTPRSDSSKFSIVSNFEQTNIRLLLAFSSRAAETSLVEAPSALQGRHVGACRITKGGTKQIRRKPWMSSLSTRD